MTIAYSAMLIAVLLPYLWVMFAKGGKNYDNHNPRSQQATLEGRKARAVAAHNNAFEAMPMFLAAVLVASQAGVPQERIDLAAIVWVVARVAHGALYLADLAWQRSAVWFIGLACVVFLMAQAILR